MKTINEIKKEIDQAVARKDSDSELRRLRSIEIYLETCPDEDFLVKTLENHREHLELIQSKYQDWLKNTPEAWILKNPRPKYNTLTIF